MGTPSIPPNGRHQVLFPHHAAIPCSFEATRDDATQLSMQAILRSFSLLLAYLSRMLRRMTDARRALLRKLEHASAFPMVALQAIANSAPSSMPSKPRALLRARELGASLEDIAEALEIARQGVSYRLKALADAGHDDGPADDEIVDVGNRMRAGAQRLARIERHRLEARPVVLRRNVIVEDDHDARSGLAPWPRSARDRSRQRSRASRPRLRSRLPRVHDRPSRDPVVRRPASDASPPASGCASAAPRP